jgi:predicted ATPase/class 3 adenylate cyclase
VGVDGRPSGTVTFLFTDVEGSTGLWAEDPAAMAASLTLHDSLIRESLESCGGFVFSTAGDSFAAAFARGSDAVRASMTAQEALRSATWPGPVLRVRMGVHLGEAQERDGDYFGPAVNTAARVEAAGHGGQVLVTEMVRSAASLPDDGLVDLGVHRLRDVPDPVRLFQLGSSTFPALRVVDPELSNLPVRPTRLVGRDAEVAGLRRMLSEHRLVTITGVGGSGKTRVAIEVGEAELTHRAGGVWFVDLTAISSESELPGGIANATGLGLTAGDSTKQVIGFLADKSALLILDNCEHLIDACALFAEQFLASRGSSVILTTSREALDVEGEQTIVLSSLPSQSSDSPGVQLFVDRAIAANPGFELTDANAATVALICTRLDGMPLAIELAAARVTVMSPADLLAGLNQRFQLLSGRRRRQRQRTLEATLDWSYDLLEPEEQRVLRALGVFVGGFDVDAVAAVTDRARERALDVIEALVAKSLVERADVDGRVRFRLLETMKAYAEDRLVDAREFAVRDRHLDHYSSIAAPPDSRVVVGGLQVGLRLRADLANLVEAFEWAAGTGQWTRAGELILGGSGVFDIELAWVEGLVLLDRAIEHCGPSDVDLVEEMRALRATWQVLTMDPHLSSSLEELCESPVAATRAQARALTAFLGGSGPEAAALIEDAQNAADALSDDGSSASWSNVFLAYAKAAGAVARGDLAAALGFYEEITLGDQPLTVMSVRSAYSAVALLHALLGQTGAALDAIARMEQFGVPRVIGEHARVVLHVADGELDRAAQQVRVHAERSASGRYVGEAGESIYLLSALSLAEGDDRRARDLLAASHSVRTPAGFILCMHLADHFGVADQQRQRGLKWSTASQEQSVADRKEDMLTVRSEMARRGWS